MRVVVRRVSTGQRVERETPGRDRDGGAGGSGSNGRKKTAGTAEQGRIKGIGERINWLVVFQWHFKRLLLLAVERTAP